MSEAELAKVGAPLSFQEMILRLHAFWSARGQWLIEAGRIDFWIGASSADLRANGSFEITKTHTGTAPAAALPTRVIVGTN